MAPIPTIVNMTHSGNRRRRVVDVAWDSSYPTGGESLTPGDCGLAEIHTVIDCGTRVTSTGAAVNRRAYFDGATNKLLLSQAAVMTEVTAATDLSTLTTRLVVEGV